MNTCQEDGNETDKQWAAFSTGREILKDCICNSRGGRWLGAPNTVEQSQAAARDAEEIDSPGAQKSGHLLYTIHVIDGRISRRSQTPCIDAAGGVRFAPASSIPNIELKAF